MNYKISSEELCEFFDSLHGNVSCADEVFLSAAGVFSPIADKLNIGRLDVALDAPKTLIDPHGKHISSSIYRYSAGYDDRPVHYDFFTGEGGKAEFNVYPRTGILWSDETLNEVKLIVQILIVLGGRGRLMGLMNRIAVTDNLTGVNNMAGFAKSARILADTHQLRFYSGVFINIKNFKLINSRYSNRIGDEVLIRYAQKLKGFLAEDELIARPGGDNFIILVKRERENKLIELLKGTSVHIDELNIDIQLSSRAGIYCVRENDNLSNVMNGATVSLNCAKQQGTPDIVYYVDELLERTIYQEEIAASFPAAIENREFVVYYQPKVDLNNSTLCGGEALVRWIRNGEIVPPMKFIPLLEAEGLITQLDFYVFERVCADIRSWIDSGITPERISTNFSKLHLKNPDLAKNIVDIVEKYNIPCEYIEIELTETSDYDDFKAMVAFVNMMNAAGIATSIDDFGTGYSSLYLLKDLNVDAIKLDRSLLIKPDYRNLRDEIILKNIIGMVNELKMDIIAEGVETDMQADFLQEANCHITQGYLFDKPMPIDDFEKRLKNKKYQ